MVIVVPRGVRRRVRWTRNGPPGWFGSSGSAWPRSPMGQGCVQRNCHVAHHAVEEIVADVALEQFGAQQADRGEHRLLGDVCRSQLAAVSGRRDGLLWVLWTVVKNLDYGLGCRLGFPHILMDFVRGSVPERGMKSGLIAVSVQSMRLIHRGVLAFPN